MLLFWWVEWYCTTLTFICKHRPTQHTGARSRQTQNKVGFIEFIVDLLYFFPNTYTKLLCYVKQEVKSRPKIFRFLFSILVSRPDISAPWRWVECLWFILVSPDYYRDINLVIVINNPDTSLYLKSTGKIQSFNFQIRKSIFTFK